MLILLEEKPSTWFIVCESLLVTIVKYKSSEAEGGQRRPLLLRMWIHVVSEAREQAVGNGALLLGTGWPLERRPQTGLPGHCYLARACPSPLLRSNLTSSAPDTFREDYASYCCSNSEIFWRELTRGEPSCYFEAVEGISGKRERQCCSLCGQKAAAAAAVLDRARQAAAELPRR